MESQNGGAAPPWRDTKRERANYSATNGTTQGGGSQPPVQTTSSRHAPWQDDYVNIGKNQIRLEDALEEVRSYENYRKEVQIEVDEAQRHVDELQKNYVYGGRGGGGTTIGRCTGTNSVAERGLSQQSRRTMWKKEFSSVVYP